MLPSLSYKELQALAKEKGIPANAKKDILISLLTNILEENNIDSPIVELEQIAMINNTEATAGNTLEKRPLDEESAIIVPNKVDSVFTIGAKVQAEIDGKNEIVIIKRLNKKSARVCCGNGHEYTINFSELSKPENIEDDLETPSELKMLEVSPTSSTVNTVSNEAHVTDDKETEALIGESKVESNMSNSDYSVFSSPHSKVATPSRESNPGRRHSFQHSIGPFSSSSTIEMVHEMTDESTDENAGKENDEKAEKQSKTPLKLKPVTMTKSQRLRQESCLQKKKHMEEIELKAQMECEPGYFFNSAKKTHASCSIDNVPSKANVGSQIPKILNKSFSGTPGRAIQATIIQASTSHDLQNFKSNVSDKPKFFNGFTPGGGRVQTACIPNPTPVSVKNPTYKIPGTGPLSASKNSMVSRPSTLSKPSSAMSSGTFKARGVPDYSGAHSRLFSGQKSITKIIERDEKINKKMTQALDSAQKVSIVGPFTTQPRPEFVLSAAPPTVLQKENERKLQNVAPLAESVFKARPMPNFKKLHDKNIIAEKLSTTPAKMAANEPSIFSPSKVNLKRSATKKCIDREAKQEERRYAFSKHNKESRNKTIATARRQNISATIK